MPETEIEHFGGVVAVSELMARAAAFMGDYGRACDLDGIEHEANIIASDIGAVLRFVRRRRGIG